MKRKQQSLVFLSEMSATAAVGIDFDVVEGNALKAAVVPYGFLIGIR